MASTKATGGNHHRCQPLGSPCILSKEVLRLTAAGLSQRQIARSFHLSHSVVGKYQAAAQRVGLGWPLTEELDDGTLAARLGTKTDDNSGTQASARRPHLWEAVISYLILLIVLTGTLR